MAARVRVPEGREVDAGALDLFARAAALGAPMAAFRVRRILGGALRPGARLLDVGTGPGTIPLRLARACPGLAAVGLDVSLGMLGRARRFRRRAGAALDLVAADAARLPFRDGTLDVVISLFALHHLDRVDTLLAEADRVLRPGGVFLLIDFRRDMPGVCFRLADAAWRAAFWWGPGRSGFADSVRSAWTPGEAAEAIAAAELEGYEVHANSMELWIHRNLGGAR
ncbi:methyltransferase domain-containing protein [Dissulfurirhabdus thermomarina]|uniref:Methyltransferase domain-containing protein n=1 Tax=Dissulfurirhabdus thermomarina TaxID=1765737 RepID=A0A6N9TPC2_DISTH|nr:methyltransferase domain-containing protein [Dissulfurirhabdus thermomarina]NDY43121.1 methyltransferase domain-containing protein [Dissulfurirhabdus thermomarina]NMX23768.1 methyltransferase domain-containing protein [Dissulfurirhabdus thermomarina]